MKILLICILNFLPVYGQKLIILDNEETKLIGSYTSIIEDPTNRLNLNDIVLANDKFVPCTKNVFSSTRTTSTFWIKFQIKNLTGFNYYLVIDNPYINEIDLYSADKKKVSLLAKSGNHLPFSQRPIQKNNFIIPIYLSKGEKKTFYLRYSSTWRMELPLFLQTSKKIIEHSALKDLWFGMFYGTSFIIVTCISLLYIMIRDKALIYYLIFVVWGVIFRSLNNGLAYQFIFPDHPAFNNFLIYFGYSMVSIFLILFTQEFLKTKEKIPELHVWGNYLIIFHILFFLISFFSKALWSYVFILGLTDAIYQLIIGVRAYINGYIPARFYLIAAIIYFMITFFTVIRNLGFLPYSFANYNIADIYITGAVVFFSLAFGDRYNVLKKEKEKTQADLNKELELKVAERSRVNEIQKKLTENLKETLALSNATLESTADGILVVTLDSKNIRGFNQNFVKMWNIPADLIEPMVDKQVLEYVARQLKEPKLFLSRILELYDNPEKESFDVLELADGRSFERYSKPQISEDEIIGWVWSFRDITERKKTEEAEKVRVTQLTRFQDAILALTQIEIKTSLEEKLDRIVEMTSKAVEVERLGIWFFDGAQSLIRSRRIFELRNNGFIPGMTIYRKDYPGYFKAIEIFPLIDAYDANHDPRTSEFSDTYLKPLGITSMMNTPIRIEGEMIGIVCYEHKGPRRKWTHEEQAFSSSIAGIIAVSIEHERRRKAELKIKHSEKKYRFLAETVPQLFWTAQSDGEVDFYNKNTLKYTGKTLNDLRHWGWEAAIHPTDLKILLPAWKEAIKTGSPLRIEIRVLGADRKYQWFLGSATPLKDESGNVAKWFGSLTNINEQKKSAELLRLKNEELLRTNKDLDNFIYTASHDLKAPIANIEGLLNTLIDSLGDKLLEEGEPSEIVKMMTESIEKFKNVIFDLTEVSKAQKSGDINLVEDCSFIEAIAEIEDTITPLIKANNVAIHTDFGSISHIRYSRKYLRSILYNLISNAIKYRSEDRDPIINIKTELLNDYILLSVQDNGLGMRPEIVSRIFRMFKRFHTHVEGSGIGLYIVKRIIENTGGKIEVESEEGIGSTFKVYFNRK